MKKNRTLLPWEINYLLKKGFNLANLPLYGEMPVEYIVNTASFCDLDFFVNQDVLIPRLETEELLDLAITEINKQNKKEIFIADIGTGSGAVGLSILKKVTNKVIYLYLSDISEQALAIAEKNYHRLFKSSENVFFIKSDLLESYPQAIKFDFIIANLPYIPTKRIGKLDQSVKDFEPNLALDGGADGTTLINRLIRQASSRLNKKAKVILEIDDSHEKKMLKNLKSYHSVNLLKDSFGKNRFIILSL